MFSNLIEKINWEYDKYKQLTLLKSPADIFYSSKEIEARKKVKKIFKENEEEFIKYEVHKVEVAILLSKCNLLDLVALRILEAEDIQIELTIATVKKILKEIQ